MSAVFIVLLSYHQIFFSYVSGGVQHSFFLRILNHAGSHPCDYPFCYFRTSLNGSTSKTWRVQGDNLGKLGDLINFPISDIYVDEYTTTQNSTAETHKLQSAAGGNGSYFGQPHFADGLQHTTCYLMEIAG